MKMKDAYLKLINVKFNQLNGYAYRQLRKRKGATAKNF